MNPNSKSGKLCIFSILLLSSQEIRKHLREKRPRHDLISEDSATEVIFAEVTTDNTLAVSTVASGIPANAVQCKCSDR